MVIDLIGLAFLGLVAVTLLWLVPRPASRTWAAGLLVVAVICNLGTVIVTVLSATLSDCSRPRPDVPRLVE